MTFTCDICQQTFDGSGLKARLKEDLDCKIIVCDGCSGTAKDDIILESDLKTRISKSGRCRIPFHERFREPMLNGTKTWTSRTRWYGKVGYTFPAFGAEFKIIDRMKLPLYEVAEHWREEGCNSELDFRGVWTQIHPRKGFVPDQIVKVHVFRRIA